MRRRTGCSGGGANGDRSRIDDASPEDWAIRIDGILEAAGWPGSTSLGSADFQLLNRWRDLLNDLARMDLVSARMPLETALNQLESMAADAVFQPETELTQVHLLGVLEASGLEFDAVWISGVNATEWPSRGDASVMVSRRLQEERGMPDATPADSLGHARRILRRLCAAAPEVVCSYSRIIDDAEQNPSELLSEFGAKPCDAPADPGWHATQFASGDRLASVEDVPPRVVRAEKLAGGNLIHDALYKLYLEKPSRNDVANWADIDSRIARSLDFAFGRHERNADKVLLRLLAMERERVDGLLRIFLNVDTSREAFVVDSVEKKVELAEAGVRLELRVDRIDRMPDGSVAIIDYKTGAEKTLLTRQGEPKEYQLVAYACAIDEPVGELALANVDSRSVVFHAAGARDTENWPDVLAGWASGVREACAEISNGDVRINRHQSMDDARPLNLLTRFTERRNDW